MLAEEAGHKVDLLYLSYSDVIACGLAHDDITVAIENGFRAKARGTASTQPKLTLPVRPDASFAGKGGILTEGGYAAVKWYGVVAGNERRGLPDFNPLVILNSAETGLPLAVMDGRWMTGVRTASIAAAATTLLAKPDSRSIGFVACGLQAFANLETMRARFPLADIVAYSRRPESAERLAARAREYGMTARVVTDPTLAVRDRDIVVTSVPRLSEPTRFLDAALVADGAFVAMVDMGSSWNAATLHRFGFLITDDLEPGARRAAEPLNYDGEFEADIPTLLSDPARRPSQGRGSRALIFAGSGIADVAAAAAIYERAVARGVGTRLALW